MDMDNVNQIMKYIVKGAISELSDDQKLKVGEAKKEIIECVAKYGDSARLAVSEVFFEEMSKLTEVVNRSKIPFARN